MVRMRMIWMTVMKVPREKMPRRITFFFVGMRDLMSMGKGVSMLKDSLVAMIWEFGARRGV